MGRHKLKNNEGIFTITNLKTNQLFIGSSGRLNKVINNYKSLLKMNIHSCKKLQEDWNRFGSDCFRFEILAYCTKPERKEYENHLKKELKPHYNCYGKGERCKFLTEEHKRNMRKPKPRKKANQEQTRTLRQDLEDLIYENKGHSER